MVRDDFKRLLSGCSDAREYRLLTKSGAIRWVRTSGRPILKGGRFIGLRAVFADITEAKQLQAQLQHSQRMEAIGTLAGGLAHDFNNILTGIQGRASLMLLDTYPDHLYYEHLHCIEEYVKNAASLTRQLLGFAKGGLYEIKPVDLNPVIAKTVHLFGRTHKEIKIQQHFEKELWIVEADQSQIEQTFSILLFNACQAMPQGGRITLSTGNELLDEPSAKPYELQPGRYVKVSIKDTSHGIPKEIRDKIFDPLFIAEGMGRETGFGLAMAYMIIQSYGGTIAVESKEGVGAEFRIYLPVRGKKARNSPQAMTLPESHRGRETILLVEDEMDVMEVGVAMLEKLGYRVLRAASTTKAIEVFHENSGNIDLVILAILMPEMEGTEFFVRLKRLKPRVKIVLSDDYNASELSGEEIPVGHSGFIRKPFRIEELSKKIHEILGPL
jgi:signal transduction histidine kinase/CheY-like chemotaxis protein